MKSLTRLFFPLIFLPALVFAQPRAITDTATIHWDSSTAGQGKANVIASALAGTAPSLIAGNVVQTVNALASNALVLTPPAYVRSEATWSSATSNRTLTFASGATTAGNGRIIDFTFTNATTILFPASYRNGAGSTITTYTYPAGRYTLRWTVQADGSSINLEDTAATASGVPVVATPTNYTAATPDVEGHLHGIDVALASAGGTSLATESLILWPTADLGGIPAGWLQTGSNGIPSFTAIGSYSGIVKSGGNVAANTFSPAAGSYGSTQSVTLATGTIGAAIRYTTDGSTPNRTTGTVYSTAISVAATATVKAIAYKDYWADAAVQSATYTISAGPVTFVDNANRTSTGLSNPASDGVGTWGLMNGFTTLDMDGSNFIGRASVSCGWRVASPTFTGSNQRATITATEISGYWGVGIRNQGSSDSRGYSFTLNGTSGAALLQKITAVDGSTTTTIRTLTITHGTGPSGVIAAGDTMTIEATGSTIVCKVNGVTESTDTDATYSGGQPFVSAYSNRQIDSFSATTF
ncbi:MAG: chitobiase/beta-hexosaminidase C-terminal domain-containing protein [Lacunisphaera sp.]